MENTIKLKNIKNQTGNDITFGSCQVVSPSNRALYIPSIGWVISMSLGYVLITLSFLHQLEPLSMPPMSQSCPNFHVESLSPFSLHCPYSLVQMNYYPNSAIPGTITG